MKTKKLFLLATITALCFASPAMAQEPVKVHTEGLAAKIPWTGPVPKANCGRWDWTESGLQGQTTPWERESGDSEGGYNCNLELVGQFQGEGARSQGGPAYIDHCAYYLTDNNPLQQRRGVVVVDASDPRHPRPTTYLDDPVFLRPARDAESEPAAQAHRGQPKGLDGVCRL